MPHVMDAAEEGLTTFDGTSQAIECEYETARRYGQEIDKMTLDAKKAACADLLPALEDANATGDVEFKLAKLRDYNSKARKWIDKQLGLVP